MPNNDYSNKFSLNLFYTNFNLLPSTPAGRSEICSVSMSSGKNYGNRAKIVSFSPVHVSKVHSYIDSFHKDIKDWSLIYNGTATYDSSGYYGSTGFENVEISWECVYNNHYKSEDYFYHQDFSSPEKKIPTHMLSNCDAIQVKLEAELDVGPNQIYSTKMKTCSLKTVEVSYTNSILFSAVDSEGEKVIDLNLKELALKVFGEDAVLEQFNQFTYNITVGGIITFDVLTGVNLSIHTGESI